MKLERIPILMVTYNRLPYTMHAFSCLTSKYAGVPTKITIWDNNSTDGTKVWLKYLEHPDLDGIVYSNQNVGLAEPMNGFFRKNRHAKFVAKVDNDTVLPKFWLSKLLATFRHHEVSQESLYKGGIGAISGNCLRPGGLTAKDWYAGMREYDVEGWMKLRRNSYICGTGVLINMDMIRSIGLLSESEPCLMGGWTSYCRIISDLIGGWSFYFNMSVFIKLLNLEADHKASDDLPEYDEEMLVVRNDGNKWWESVGGLEGVYKYILKNGGFQKL